jgi:general secretion pathway protein I
MRKTTTKTTRKATRQLGFTLIEVLVALTIVAIALFAGTQATSALARSSQRQTDLLLAQICADNALYSLRLARQMPSVGESSGECAQANRVFTVDLKVRPTQNPSFLRVQANVSDGQEKYGILQVSTVIGRF